MSPTWRKITSINRPPNLARGCCRLRMLCCPPAARGGRRRRSCGRSSAEQPPAGAGGGPAAADGAGAARARWGPPRAAPRGGPRPLRTAAPRPSRAPPPSRTERSESLSTPVSIHCTHWWPVASKAPSMACCTPSGAGTSLKHLAHCGSKQCRQAGAAPAPSRSPPTPFQRIAAGQDLLTDRTRRWHRGACLHGQQVVQRQRARPRRKPRLQRQAR